ncbi:MAG TPA: DUF4097 family beta strand repeat-containing protein, partial [Blastocatellia bacterium]|nr:DUF4097 family beta strand repeat-containing protein [Blastocatellia bacterium]
QPPRTPRPPRAQSQPPEQTLVEPVSVKLGRGGKLTISSPAGGIAISGWDRDVVQASATGETGPVPIETQTTGDAAHPRLLLVVPAPSARRYAREAKLDVKVPRYADLETLEGYRGDIEVSDVDGTTLIDLGSGDVKATRVGPLKVSRRHGDITVKQVKGDFTVRSFHGDTIVENVSGLVDLATTSGNLAVRNAGGDVRTNSMSGNIEIRCAKGRAEANSASGSVTLIGLASGVEASTVSGSVIFTGTISDGANYRLRSFSGEVEMRIQHDPPGFTATVSTYTGEIETAFPLKIESPVQGGPINRRLTGTFGNGKAKLLLDSFSGAVKIAKASDAALKECK